MLVACDIIGDKELARTSLEKLKAAVDRFATNKQRYGLVYESKLFYLLQLAFLRSGCALAKDCEYFQQPGKELSRMQCLKQATRWPTLGMGIIMTTTSTM